MKSMRQRAIDGIQTGDSFTVSRSFSEQDVERFAEVSRDYNPVHFDAPYAKLLNFKTTVSHGLLTASLLTEIGGQIGWLAAGMTLRFKRPVHVGEAITCLWTIREIDARGRARAEIRMTNPEGVVVLEAETMGVLPGAQERARMAAMVAQGDPTNGAV